MRLLNRYRNDKIILYITIYSYLKTLTGLVLTAIIVGISAPTVAAITADNAISKAVFQSTSFGILLNIYTLLFQSFKPKIILIHSSIVFIFLVIMSPNSIPIPEPTRPTQIPKPIKIDATEPFVAPQLFIIAMSFCRISPII